MHPALAARLPLVVTFLLPVGAAAVAVLAGPELELERLLLALAPTPCLLLGRGRRRLLPGALALPPVLYVLVRLLRPAAGMTPWAVPPWLAEWVPALVFAALALQGWLGLRGWLRAEAHYAAELEEARQLRSEFFVDLSHEIRAPLTTIQGYADLLRDACDGVQLEQVEAIRRDGDHLLALLSNVLDLAKLEAGCLSIERMRCNLDRLLRDLHAQMEPQAQARGLRLELRYRDAIPEMVLTDPLRVRQILRNLVDNGIKFTEEGFVRIEAWSGTGARGDVMLEISVCDTGAGLTSDRIEQIFHPFVRGAPAGQRRAPGVGLGLAVSRRLASRLGGRLEVESHPGHGSAFVLSLAVEVPAGTRMIRRPEPVRRTDVYQPRLGVGLLHVLVAEDSPDNQQVVATMLRRAGAQVSVADNGRAAISMAMAAQEEGRAFDVIVMDTQMPVVDGYEAIAQLRRMGYERPIVALTACSVEEDGARCLRAGCDDFLSKPVDRRQLLEVVRRAGSGEKAYSRL